MPESSLAIGINGFGRMGRLALRAAWGWPELRFAHVNELHGDAATAAHLLEFDSVHGRWDHNVDDATGRIAIDDESIGYSRHPLPGDVPWDELGIEVVLECSGKFRTPEALEGYFARGVRKVIVAAPVKDAERPEPGGRGERRALRARAARHRHRRLVHHELPRTRRQGDPRGNRDPPRLDDDPARPDQHADRRRRAPQGPPPGSRRGRLADPHDHRLGHRDRADLPRAARAS